MFAVCCHDAGGSEIISSYVLREKLDPLFCLSGPAVEIFERKLGKINNIKIREAISQIDWLLCGTSWQSSLEWEALELAKQQKVHSVTFLDHWVNYYERFVRSNVKHLPDEIWVGDNYAKSIVTEIFPKGVIKLVNNPFLESIHEEYRKITRIKRSTKTGVQLLFVSDNIGEASIQLYGDEQYFGYNDNDVLNYCLNNIDTIDSNINKIIIRPHPSESIKKYRWAKNCCNQSVELGGKLTLLEEIAQSDIVVGANSMAMVVALHCGKRVVSCIPPGGKKRILPQEGIEKL